MVLVPSVSYSVSRTPACVWAPRLSPGYQVTRSGFQVSPADDIRPARGEVQPPPSARVAVVVMSLTCGIVTRRSAAGSWVAHALRRSRFSMEAAVELTWV